MRQFLKNISYSFAANVISMLVGILSVLVFPKLISVENFGYYQLYIFYTCYIVITSFGWADGIYLKNGGKDYLNLDKEEINTQFWMLTIAQLLIYVLLSLGTCAVQDIDKRSILLLVCIGAVGIQMRYFLYLLLQATNRIKEYAYVIITERIFSVLGGLLIILCGYRGYYWLIVIDMLGRMISMLLATWYCRDIVFRKPVIKKIYIEKIAGYMLPGSMVLLATLTSTIVIGVVRFGIEDYWDIATFSKVSLTISISNMAVRCINSVGVVMFPTLRRIQQERLPAIYEIANTMLMTLIFTGLLFYQPFAALLRIWLPQYTEGIRYAAILLPVCAYECKNVMLVSTYLKNYCAEKVLLLSNAISIVLSMLAAGITIYVWHSVECAVLSMLLALMIRCIIGEIYLGHRMHMSLYGAIVSEMVVVILFVFCNWKLGWIGLPLYLAALVGYMYMHRKKNREVIIYMKQRTHAGVCKENEGQI